MIHVRLHAHIQSNGVDFCLSSICGNHLHWHRRSSVWFVSWLHINPLGNVSQIIHYPVDGCMDCLIFFFFTLSRLAFMNILLIDVCTLFSRLHLKGLNRWDIIWALVGTGKDFHEASSNWQWPCLKVLTALQNPQWHFFFSLAIVMVRSW